MTANFHTHTFRCNHAKGTDREYVEKAIELGFTELGFSDHMPQLYPDGKGMHFQMDLSQVAEYVDSISALKQEYADKIKIYIGFESEYYKGITEKTLDFFRGYPINYLILGQHLLDDYRGETPLEATTDKTRLTRYVNSVISAIKTGKFSLIAHPDIINYTSEDEFYHGEMKRLCIAAKNADIPLECNMLGTGGYGNRRRHYPSERFFRIAAEVGNEVIISCDAHEPEMLGNPDGYKICRKILRDVGITPIEKLKLIKP